MSRGLVCASTLLWLGCAADPPPVTVAPPPSPTAAPAPAPTPIASRALAPAHAPVGGVLPAGVGPIRELHFGKEFRYVGGHRFILKNAADAEQHFFVTPPEPGLIRRLYWIQFERLLPGVGTEYNYSADQVLQAGGVPFRLNLRRWDTPPVPGSDRAAMYEFLEKNGYQIPEGAVRIRLVHVPETDTREELMIVYAEAPEPGKPPLAEADVERRALEGMRVIAK